MRAKLVAVSLIATAVISFWGGHAYSEYRALQVISEMTRSSALTGPEVAVRCAELAEKGDSENASSRMREVARVLFNTPKPSLGEASPSVWLTPPTFGPIPGLETLQAMNNQRESDLREKLAAR